jgi:acyl-[acyl-carrier-protein]-phospholipid O-acyltransferase/long-chain-fatty-acid--[acyl-carrier-protein] ligase
MAYKTLLKSVGFQSFLWTQFFGAFNDNLYKTVVTMFAIATAVGSEEGIGQVSLILGVFILPFFLFSGYAGFAADRWNKRSILIGIKIFEIFVMAMGIFALGSGRIEWMLVILFLMGLHSAFFSPAKYGIVPEMVPNKDLSRANGLLEMSTFFAIILGTSIGTLLFVSWKQHPEYIGFILTVIAILGTIISFGITRVPNASSQGAFQISPWAEIVQGVKTLYPNKALWLTVLGSTYFWFLGALLQSVLTIFGKEVMGLEEFWIGILLTFLAIGIGFGSLVAGRLSGDKVELGLVPLGSIGIGIFSLLLPLSSHSYSLSAALLLLLGVSAGFFIVPLNAFLQQKSGAEEKGRLIATANFMNTCGMLLAAGTLSLLGACFKIPADIIIAIFGVVSFLVTIYLLTILPDFLLRFTLWMLTHTIYKIRILGQSHVPFRGPALLIANHVSYVDGLLIGACLQRFIRFMVYQPIYETPGLHRMFRLMNAIPISIGNRREVIKSLQRAQEELRQGHVVCIFAEGAISRTGNLLPFKKGFERIMKGLDVPIIPIYLSGVWGSIFSFERGRFFWKWPTQIPYPVTVAFGQALPSTTTAETVRHVLMELGSEVAEQAQSKQDLLPLKFIQSAKSSWWRFAMVDSTGKQLTFGKTLIVSLLLSRVIRAQCQGQSMIGILLPASVGGALTNIAILLAGKIPVNLNFTSGPAAMDSAIRQCAIKTILSSRVFIEKTKISNLPGTLTLEEIFKKFTGSQQIIITILAYLLPSGLLHRIFSPEQKKPNELATVIFSSGSTGDPKGVMLSHHNILSNIDAITQVFKITSKDRIMGVLPFFHSFGFTGTLWFPLIRRFGAVYHSNPMDSKKIGEMVFQYRATIMISTPTFYSAYIRRCSPEEFSSLRYAIVGAEKLRSSIADAFREKYNLTLLEGYGCTEMSPVVSVNIPDVVDGKEIQRGTLAGTVSHPIPGVAVKVVDPESGVALPDGQEGLLLVKGPNRMLGYLGQEEKTAQVIQNGWYNTGDIACLDAYGFIRITDRLSRFSKIGGEMVPHLKIEELAGTLLKELGYPDAVCAVTAIPDEQKGESLILFYTALDLPPKTIWTRINESEFPKLWVPKRECCYAIESLPVLGSGKIDLRAIKHLAIQKMTEIV